MPAWVSPNMLTAVGVAGAVITAAGYILTNQALAFLWLASLGLAINWFGDSLDGTLARFRKIERPDYGFFVDHMTDLGAELLVALSIGMTALLKFDIACLGVIVYLAFSTFTFIKTVVTREIRITFGGLGPTEVRCMLIALNALFFCYQPSPMIVLWEPLTPIDLGFLLLCLIEVVVLVVVAIREARKLSRLDP
jgi:phosphatidylglycerophosphate synthase